MFFVDDAMTRSVDGNPWGAGYCHGVPSSAKSRDCRNYRGRTEEQRARQRTDAMAEFTSVSTNGFLNLWSLDPPLERRCGCQQPHRPPSRARNQRWEMRFAMLAPERTTESGGHTP